MLSGSGLAASGGSGSGSGSASGGGGGAPSTSASSTSGKGGDAGASPSWFLRACFVLNVVAGCSAGAASVVFAVDVFRNLSAADGFVSAYSAALAGLAAAAETEHPSFLARFPALESWIVRGSWLLFLGALLLHFNALAVAGDDDLASSLWAITRSTVGYSCVAVGGVYAAGGAACMKRVKDHQLHTLRRREQARHEKFELESKKQEIETLLHEAEAKLERM